MKPKTIFRCSICGATQLRWAGQCPACSEWNTLAEELVATATSPKSRQTGIGKAGLARTASELTAQPLQRIGSGIDELDRVLGGGTVPGSFVLLGGEPGIGKSTLTLQLAAAFAERVGTVLLSSGEESAEQIALRAQRTATAHPRLQILAETCLENILATANATNPSLLIVDSAQVVHSESSTGMTGSVPQVRAVAEGLLHYAKTTGTPVVLIGHVTKEGDLAGPRVLAHLVDVVLTLEGDPHRDFRLLRATKNRFGATSEIGVFEMVEAGLQQVTNPSAAFLSGRAENPIGSVVTATVEGTRPLLVEVQALTSTSSFGYPRRAASGFDANRLQLLLAVLQRHAGIRLDTVDVFVNVVGGFRLREPAADLAICLALMSSKLQTPLPVDLVAWGEVGLTGEIRMVNQAATRIAEAKKMGFKKVASSKEFHSLAAAAKLLSPKSK